MPQHDSGKTQDLLCTAAARGWDYTSSCSFHVFIQVTNHLGDPNPQATLNSLEARARLQSSQLELDWSQVVVLEDWSQVVVLSSRCHCHRARRKRDLIPSPPARDQNNYSEYIYMYTIYILYIFICVYLRFLPASPPATNVHHPPTQQAKSKPTNHIKSPMCIRAYAHKYAFCFL